MLRITYIAPDNLERGDSRNARLLRLTSGGLQRIASAIDDSLARVKRYRSSTATSRDLIYPRKETPTTGLPAPRARIICLLRLVNWEHAA